MDELVLPNLSYIIIGALFKVHSTLGPSLLEKYYQRACAEAFNQIGLHAKREIRVELNYENTKIGWYSLDFLIEDLVILETKASRAYNPNFFKQTLAYLKATNFPLAIIANFRRPSLQFKRIVNTNPEGLNILREKDKEFASIREKLA